MTRHLIINSLATCLALTLQTYCLAYVYTYPECGIANETSLQQNNPAPWIASVAVFEDFDLLRWENIKLLLTGVIISPTKILILWNSHVSYLLFGEINSVKLPNPRSILVSVGFQSEDIRRFDVIPRDLEQISVEYVIPYFINSSWTNTRYISYPVILHLTTPLNFSSPFVKPICIPTVPPGDKNESSYSIASGFEQHPAQASGILIKPSVFKLEDTEWCEWLLISATNRSKYWFGDPICAYQEQQLFPTEENNCGAETVAVAAQHAGRFFLNGFGIQVYSEDLNASRSCNSSIDYYYHGFDVQDEKIKLWVLQNIVCKENEFACSNSKCIPMSQVCNHVRDCSPEELSSLDEDLLLCNAINICKNPKSFSCAIGGPCLSDNQLCDGTPDCVKTGADEFPQICQAFRKNVSQMKTQQNQNDYPASSVTVGVKNRGLVLDAEPDIGSSFTTEKFCQNIFTSMEITKRCSFLGKNISCQESNKVGTKMEMKCAPYYVANSKYKSVELTCKEDGNWKPYKFLTCEADCGRLDGIVETGSLIADGFDLAKRKLFPWYVAIFVSESSPKTNTRFAFACGASLIDESLVLSAASCLTDNFGYKFQLQRIRIVLAPASRNFKLNLINGTSVIQQVSEIHIPPTFNSQTLNSDISLLKLTNPIQFNQRIQPICYLTSKGKDVPSLGNIGLVAGFGENQNDGTSEEHLTWGYFPIVANDECFENLPHLSQLNTFCAGNTSASQASICSEDAGGGIAFREYQSSGSRYFLKGIVSKMKEGSEDNCASPQVFTHVDAFSDWVLDIL